MSKLIAIISIVKDLIPLIKEVVAYFKSLPEKRRQKKLRARINERAELTRQLEVAIERKDTESIKRISDKLHDLTMSGL